MKNGMTRLELCSGDKISIVQAGAMNTSSTGSPFSSNSICSQPKTATSGTIERPPKVSAILERHNLFAVFQPLH